jgi:transcriptional regulator with XRE-family HTH domain
MSEPRSAPTVGQVVLGRRLLDLRERAGIRREDAARILHVAPATVRRMETAEVALKIPYLQLLLKAYGWWQRFHDILPNWFSMYVSLEGAAGLIRSYDPHFVPGLLQTEGYARAVMVSGAIGQTRPDDIERHVALRMQRQELLTRKDAPRLWFVMDETALRRPVGGPDVTELSHVTVQVTTFDTGPHPGTYGPFVLFRFAMPELPDMVYSEYLTGAVYLDDRSEVATHLEVMDRMAAQAATAQRTKEILRDLRKEL